MKQRILFVCLGNICRSPAAHGVLEALVEREGITSNYTIDSAGTYGGHAGELPDARMREAALQRGYTLTHRSRQFREEDFDLFDRIIVMDDSNYHNVCELAPSREAADRVERFAHLLTKSTDYHYIPDPYYEGREGFELVLDLLEEGCERIISGD